MTDKEKNLRSDKVEVSLKDVFAFLLLHIRITLIFALVAGICFALFKGYGAYKGARSQNEQAAAQQAALAQQQADSGSASVDDSEDTENTYDISKINDMTEDEFLAQYGTTAGNTERTTNSYVDILKFQMRVRNYYDHSDMLQLDPSNTPTTKTDFIITPSAEAATSTKASLYTEYLNLIKDPIWLQETAEKYGYNTKYFYDCIFITPTADTITGADSLLFQMQVVGKNEDDTMNITKDILDRLPDITSQLSSIAASTVTVVTQETYTGDNETVRSAQTAAHKNYVEIGNNVNYAGQVVNYANIGTYTVAGGDTSIISTVSVRAVTFSAMKKAFVSGFFAAFIIFWIILIIVYNVAAPLTKFKFFAIFNFRELGSLRDGIKNLYRHKSKYDRGLRHSMGIEDEKDIDKASNMVLSNLSVYTPDEKKYLIVDLSIKAKKNADDAFATKLSETLNSKTSDMKFIPSGDIINNAENRKKLLTNDAVIFCAEYGHIKNDYLNEVYSVVSSSDLDIAGVVLR